ncbi:MAG: hypothetical protein JOY78_02480 [Pseudonocardia sp.]|nr:hypothetical protein [Pseudonocardia sp.]
MENVWTALSGQVRPDVLVEVGLRAVYGSRKRMCMGVGSAIRFGPRVATLDKLIALIRWLAARSRAPLPDEDDWEARCFITCMAGSATTATLGSCSPAGGTKSIGCTSTL